MYSALLHMPLIAISALVFASKLSRIPVWALMLIFAVQTFAPTPLEIAA
jgi:hypothetical protein